MKDDPLGSRRQALWPLHPRPKDYETIERWVQRLADEYGVSMPMFCRHALGLAQDKINLLRFDLPEEILQKLEVGTGVAINQLREMSNVRVFQRLMEAVERLAQEDPGSFASFLGIWGKLGQADMAGDPLFRIDSNRSGR